MATSTTFAHRLLIAGGFAVAVSAAPLVAALTSPAGPIAPALADCPANEVLDQASGACKPITDQPGPSFNPVDPGITNLQPGSVTSGEPDNVGTLPEGNYIPCNGQNTGLCIGLEQNNPANTGGVQLPPVPIGETP